MASPDRLIATLLKAWHFLYRRGFIEGFGHISARQPEGNRFLLTRHSLGPKADADDFLVVDMDGRKISGRGEMPGEYPIHLEILRPRAEIGSVSHYHGMYSTAFTSSEQTLRAIREKALSIANTADSLLKAERTAQERLAQQLKQTEAENLALKNDLGFFERLLPAGAGDSVLSIRGLQAEAVTPGQLRYQLLLMQPGRARPEFSGRYEVSLVGTLDGKPWSLPQAGGVQPLQVWQYRRVEGLIDHPPLAVIKTVTVKVTDSRGAVLASHSVQM